MDQIVKVQRVLVACMLFLILGLSDVPEEQKW